MYKYFAFLFLILFSIQANAVIPGQITTYPSIPKNTGTTITSIIIKNNNTVAQPCGIITFGLNLIDNNLTASSTLATFLNGVSTPSQFDVKTTYTDGSAKMGVLTLLRPNPLSGSATTLVTVQPASKVSASPISLNNISNWTFLITITTHGSNPQVYTINVPTMLNQAITSGTVSNWLSGPIVSQGRIDVPVTGSLHVVLDISRYSDSTMLTDVSFDNDYAMQSSGGTLNYDVSIVQNNVVAFSQTNITHYQYQTWHTAITTLPVPNVVVSHDPIFMESTAALPFYDPSAAIATATISAYTKALSGTTSGFTTLGNYGLNQNMGNSSADSGLLTQADIAWLFTFDANAQAFAADQVEGGGSIPWHFFNPSTGHFLTTNDYPNLYAPSGLTQPISSSTGWTIDFNNAPNIGYLPYILTGKRYYLDQLNAEASAAIMMNNLSNRQKTFSGTTTDTVVVGGSSTPQASAWSLREQIEAAWINPDNSPESTYFNKIVTDNFNYLLTQTPTLVTNEGTSYGWIPTTASSYPRLLPWQQDDFVSVVGLSAQQGLFTATTNSLADQEINWAQNFFVGRESPLSGFNPYDGSNSSLIFIGTPNSQGTIAQGWAALEAKQVSGNNSNGSGWNYSQGFYPQSTLQGLATVITNTENPDAIYDYAWMIANGPQTYMGGVYNYLNPNNNIMPIMIDGSPLLGINIFDITDTTNHTFTIGGNTYDTMFIDNGSGNDVIQGGTGVVNVLHGGSGSDYLVGGTSYDYLIAGTGATTMYANNGINSMFSGTGADTFVEYYTDVATDTITGFKLNTDHIYAIDSSGVPFTSAEVAAAIRNATVDTNGNAIIHISAGHPVTLIGITITQLNSSMFVSVEPTIYGSSSPISVSSLSGWNFYNTTNNIINLH